MEVCQGLGPSDHQLLWLHLGPGGNDDRRSYSVSDDACKHSSYNFFVCFFFSKETTDDLFWIQTHRTELNPSLLDCLEYVPSFVIYFSKRFPVTRQEGCGSVCH